MMKLSLAAAALCLSLVACDRSSAPSQSPEPAEPVSGALPEASLPPAGSGEATPPAPPRPSAKRAPCTTDQSCNADPAVSALWGRCTDLGVCECNPGFELNPRGSCEPHP